MTLRYDEPVSSFAFNFNLRRYNEVRARAMYRVEVRRRMHDNVTNTRRNRFGMKDNRSFDPNVYNRKAGAFTRPIFGLTLAIFADTLWGLAQSQGQNRQAPVRPNHICSTPCLFLPDVRTFGAGFSDETALFELENGRV